MKIFPVISAILIPTLSCLAQSDVEIVNSSSSVKEYMICTDPTRPTDSPSEFRIAVYDSKIKKKISQLPGTFRKDDDTPDIDWHPTKPIVGIAVSDSRRFSHLELFCVADNSVSSIKIPDYELAALKLVKATKNSNTCFIHLMGWHGDLLIFHLIFNAKKKDSNEFQGLYSCTVALKVDTENLITSIDSIAPPVEQ